MHQIPMPQVDVGLLEQVTNQDDRRSFVGNAVYPQILSILGEAYAGKITGMIIDESAVDIKRLLLDQGYLNQQVNDAYYMLLNAHQQ